VSSSVLSLEIESWRRMPPPVGRCAYRPRSDCWSTADPIFLDAELLTSMGEHRWQHPLALQLRNLQTLIEIGVDKNTTVVFPEPS
jgi:hypothetical protein